MIPDVHLKPWIFDKAAEIMRTGAADRALCLMDIPDDWGSEYDLDLYEETFDAAAGFLDRYPDTLWCYGNHDLSYLWQQPESGFSAAAIPVVTKKLNELREALPDERQMAYIHRIDDVLFMHGGLTDAFVRYYASDVDYDDTDAVTERINSLGMMPMWDDASPIWFRPLHSSEKMYREKDILQVVGHTPVMQIDRRGSVVTCDLFSTYRSGGPIGTQEFLLIDTETWNYRGIGTDRSDLKIELHRKGYNCGQIITALTGGAAGWDVTACEGLSDMCESCGEICSTLKGGDYCINRYIRETTARGHGVTAGEVYDALDVNEQMEMMKASKDMSRQMYERFREKNGSLFCSELRTDNMAASCAKYVDDVTDILEELFRDVRK